MPVIPSTTVGSLKVSYAKDAYPDMELWEIASNLVIMHASVSLPDDMTVSSIPFSGDFDCLEAVLDLGKFCFVIAESLHQCCQPCFFSLTMCCPTPSLHTSLHRAVPCIDADDLLQWCCDN